MNRLSKLATSRALAIALAFVLFGFGAPALQAKHHHQVQNQCTVQSSQVVAQCPAPVLREKPTVPPAATCCPVDPKDLRKAEKASEHAQHEAAEACKRQQKEVAKAQARIDKAQAKSQQKIDDANARLEQRRAEWQQANEEYASLSNQTGPTSEAVAEVKQPEPEIERSKPTPEAAPSVEPAPEPMPQATQEPTPAPAPTPMPESNTSKAPESTQAAAVPKELPRTAGDQELLALVGLLSITTGYVTRFSRS